MVKLSTYRDNLLRRSAANLVQLEIATNEKSRISLLLMHLSPSHFTAQIFADNNFHYKPIRPRNLIAVIPRLNVEPLILKRTIVSDNKDSLHGSTAHFRPECKK